MELCYLCNKITRIFFKRKGRSILRCDNCLLTYTVDSVWVDEKNRENGEKFVKEYLKEEALYKDYFNSIIKLILKYKEPKSLLDVGCNIGVFLQTANEAGFKGTGVDMNKEAVEYARSHGLDVKLGKVENLKLKPGSFDVVTLFQTIEHLKDPVAMLKKLHSLLRKDGILVMTTPNEESSLAKLTGKLWFGYTNMEHLYFFNKKSLKLIQRKAGFKRIVIHTENSRVFSLPWALTRIFEYYYNSKSPLRYLFMKSKPYLKHLNWIKFREPDVNLVSVAVK